MIGDILVGALLILSGFINVLAIGAFWITPSLRTTANRFVINLLLVNFVSCLILSPFAFNVNANSPTSFIASSQNNGNNNTNSSSSIDDNDYYHNVNASRATDVVRNELDSEKVMIFAATPTAVECSNKTLECLKKSNEAKPMSSANKKYKNNNNIKNVFNTNNLIETIEIISLRKYQIWSLDLVVALSVLSVLLVILDTFIAVTDPLRYHARISDLKAWLFIALCWILSISFGIASALRQTAADDEIFLSDSVINDKVFNTTFLLTYFLLIIIMPFLLVILMYWRIYSEARESGQRMRNNGSSPLLQSALNLAATANAHQQQSTILTNPQCMLLMSTSPHHHHDYHHHHHHNHLANKQQLIVNKHDNSNTNNFFINIPNINNHVNNNNNNSSGVNDGANDGLTLKIDKQDSIGDQQDYLSFNNNNNTDGMSNGAFSDQTKTFLLSSPPHECMLGTIDENNSVGPKSQQHQNILLTLTTVCEQTMRRNHSVKHLHLLTETGNFNGSGSASCSNDTKIVELRQVQSTPNLQHITSSELMTGGREQTLELPSVQASPKALRYMTSLRHRLSNASSLFKYREEGRAARISILGETKKIT